MPPPQSAARGELPNLFPSVRHCLYRIIIIIIINNNNKNNIVPQPDPSLSLQVTTDEVFKCIRSFPAGSSAGPDGLRPNHLLDMVNCRESGDALLIAITAFTNCILSGSCPPAVIPVFFGGRLIAFQEKTGGIRPIAIGYTLRRLVAKCASMFVLSKLENFFSLLQVGVGVPGGCEAAVHATGRFEASMPSGYKVAKLDFSNAFNSIRRDTILETVHRFFQEISSPFITN